MTFKWNKVFKIGSNKIFKGCLPQILLGPFLNTFSQILNEEFDIPYMSTTNKKNKVFHTRSINTLSL